MTSGAAWSELCKRGACSMSIVTRSFIRREHRAFLPTPFAAQIHPDGGDPFVLHFESESDLAQFVADMLPTVLEFHHDGEHTELAARLRRNCPSVTLH